MAKTKASAKTAARGHTPVVRGRTAKAAADVAPAQLPELLVQPPPTRGPTKQAVVIGLLQREGGATLADLVVATGWLPHTTRAALTRLRQAGHVLDKTTGETGATAYRIAAPARAARFRKAA
jgi:hypothetical protein